jgi:hypothetical protein
MRGRRLNCRRGFVLSTPASLPATVDESCWQGAALKDPATLASRTPDGSWQVKESWGEAVNGPKDSFTGRTRRQGPKGGKGFVVFAHKTDGPDPALAGRRGPALAVDLAGVAQGLRGADVRGVGGRVQ